MMSANREVSLLQKIALWAMLASLGLIAFLAGTSSILVQLLAIVLLVSILVHTVGMIRNAYEHKRYGWLVAILVLGPLATIPYYFVLYNINTPRVNDSGFLLDNNVRKIAEGYTLDCIDFVKNSFDIELDGSDASVLELEPILGELSIDVKAGKVDADRIESLTKMFGYYIGETFRKNHGDVDWGWITIDGEQMQGMGNTDSSYVRFFPVARVTNRIHLGEENNVAHYYLHLTEKLGAE